MRLARSSRIKNRAKERGELGIAKAIEEHEHVFLYPCGASAQE